MSGKGPRQSSSPLWLSSDAPLTDEDSADIFFSFDITSLAFLWEQERTADDASLARITSQETAGDLSGIGGLIWSTVGDCLKKPTNYAYLALAVLIFYMASNLRPLHESTMERITAMLAPEMAVPKPPPAPRRETLKQEKPEKKARIDKPREEEALKKIAKPTRRLEPPQKRKLFKQQRQAEPLPDQKFKVSRQNRKNPQDSPRLQVNSGKRAGDPPSTGSFKVRAARRGEAPADIPAAFATTKKRTSGEIAPAKLSSVGVKPRRDAPERDEDQQLKVRSVQRVEPLDTEAKHDDLAKPNKVPVNLRAEEDLRGVWQKIENIGPLAQLNALCYGRRSGEIVYQGFYRIKCLNNQIIEAWRKKSGK